MSLFLNTRIISSIDSFLACSRRLILTLVLSLSLSLSLALYGRIINKTLATSDVQTRPELRHRFLDLNATLVLNAIRFAPCVVR